MSATAEGEELHVLFHASKLGRTDIIQSVVNSLKKQNKDLDIANFLSTVGEDGNTSLHIASHFGHSDVVRALLNFGADPSILPTKGDFLGKSAYEVANNSVKETFHVYIFEQIAMGRSDTVELLINGRVPTDLCDDSPSQDSLLHWACSFDQFPVAELLLKNHVNPNIVNANGQSCLHLACQSGNNKFVDLLLDYGANVSIKDSSGKTPLDLVPANIPINPRLVNTQHKVPLLNIPEIQEQDVNNRTESCLDSDGESGYDTDTSDPLDRINYQNSRQSYPPKQLILWPPVQRQTQYSKEDHPPLILSNDSPVVICSDSDDIDIYPLLTWSGLIDTLNNLGLQSSVQRAALSGKIRLSIDSIVCPGRQRFEILISSNEARLTASDPTGLLYAVHTFVQIIQLHSDFSSSEDYSMNKILIPAMQIIDWPDIPNRGVVWCYRNSARTISSSMKSLVRLFSSLRINQLYLAIDAYNSESLNQLPPDSLQSLCSKVCSLDEISRRHFVELIPLITISHDHDRLPLDIARNFSSPTITIILNIGLDHASRNASVSSHWLEKCHNLFKEALSAGHKHVILVCIEFISDFAKLIQHVALTVGISLHHYLPENFIPLKYHMKPITSTQYMGVHALALAKDVYERGATFSIYPAMSDSDFLYPTILYKHNCYLHAGASWNRHAFEEILGNGLLDDHTLLRPSLKFFLFSQPGNQEDEKLRDIVLDLLTTPLSGTICTNFGDIARVESYLWTLLTSSQYPSDILLPFKKEEIVECLKSFRSILTATGWKVSNPNTRPDTNNSNPSRTAKSQLDISNHLNHSTDHMVSKVKETEEFLHILHLLSIVSRSLILAWNSYEKVQIQSNTSPVYSPSGSNYSEATLESLLNCLTPGSASDLANMILEGVKLCYHHVWLKRYESLHIRHGFHDLHINLHSRSSDEDHQIHSPGSQSILRNRYLRAGKLLRMIDRKRYMSVQHIELPVRCIFQQICKHIPTYSVDVLHHIVDPSTQAINSHTPTLPTPPPQSSSSWSLWRR